MSLDRRQLLTTLGAALVVSRSGAACADATDEEAVANKELVKEIVDRTKPAAPGALLLIPALLPFNFVHSVGKAHASKSRQLSRVTCVTQACRCILAWPVLPPATEDTAAMHRKTQSASGCLLISCTVVMRYTPIVATLISARFLPQVLLFLSVGVEG